MSLAQGPLPEGAWGRNFKPVQAMTNQSLVLQMPNLAGRDSGRSLSRVSLVFCLFGLYSALLTYFGNLNVPLISFGLTSVCIFVCVI